MYSWTITVRALRAFHAAVGLAQFVLVGDDHHLGAANPSGQRGVDLLEDDRIADLSGQPARLLLVVWEPGTRCRDVELPAEGVHLPLVGRCPDHPRRLALEPEGLAERVLVAIDEEDVLVVDRHQHRTVAELPVAELPAEPAEVLDPLLVRCLRREDETAAAVARYSRRHPAVPEGRVDGDAESTETARDRKASVPERVRRPLQGEDRNRGVEPLAQHFVLRAHLARIISLPPLITNASLISSM